MPEVKTDEERGAFGVWLRTSRERIEMSAAEVAERVGVKEPWYRALEAGSPMADAPHRRPGRRLMGALEALYGPCPPEARPRGNVGTSGRLKALEARVAAIEGRLGPLAVEAVAQGVEEARLDDAASRHERPPAQRP